MSFVHLHVHSEYSLLDGLIKIPRLIEKTKELAMPAVALTDHGSMYGAFQFYIKAKNAGIKPIIGLEAYVAKNLRSDKPAVSQKDHFHLTLLAKSYKGYKNLLRLTSEAHLTGFYYKPRIDFDILAKYSKDLIVLSGCMSGQLAKHILNNQTKEAEALVSKYKELFGDDYYLEIQRQKQIGDSEKIVQANIAFSKKYAIPLVATADCHYENKEDAYAQEILLCIQTLRTISEKNRPMSMYDVPEYYFKTPAEMKGLFLDIPESIQNTLEITEKSNIEIPFGKWILPIYTIPKNHTYHSFLKEEVYRLVSNKVKITPEVKKRIEWELAIIEKKDYSSYFLIVADFVNWAKNNKIAVGPGRGSAAGSLVAYILNITAINPLDYNLPFERFLNPERPTPPDFDIDFADVRRDEVIEYVTEKYGKEKVAQIITFGRMEARLAVRDVARALGMSYSEGDRISKMIPTGKQGFAMTLDAALNESTQLKATYTTEPDVKKVIDIAKKLEGIARHSSVHAAGVVIADKPLYEYVPLQRESKGDRIITQYDMYSLDLNAVSNFEAVGLLKMDFLGLRNLTIIENAIVQVKQRRNIDINIQTVPLDDKKTFSLLSSGNTIGVFQLESRGMRKLAKDLHPNKLTDIIAMVALYRPGPMDLIPEFLKGKKDPKSIKYLHPSLKPILAETYGILVYQEQVMQIAHQLASYSMAEADSFRMAMGKKKKELMAKEHEKFVKKCIENGMTKEITEKIYGFIEKFASYGFNKPHSACYGLIAYWTAYMKANYPVEYMTSLLTAELQGAAGPVKEAKIFQSIEECNEMKIKVLPPNVNTSCKDFTIENDAIRFGFSAIKNVGHAAINSILTNRNEKKFSTFRDFLSRVDLRKVNKKTVESLIKAGAFENFGNRATLLMYYAQIIPEISKNKQSENVGQFDLFNSTRDPDLIDILPRVSEFTDDEIITMEKEVLGFSIGKNPLIQFKSILDKKVKKKLAEFELSDVGKVFIIGGIISSIKKVSTKKNNHQMAFVTIFDETSTMELVIFPKIYAKTTSIWRQNTAILAKGVINNKDDTLTFTVNDVVDLNTIK